MRGAVDVKRSEIRRAYSVLGSLSFWIVDHAMLLLLVPAVGPTLVMGTDLVDRSTSDAGGLAGVLPGRTYLPGRTTLVVRFQG